MEGFRGVALAFILILGCSILSYFRRHQLEKEFLWSSIRTVLQLILLGYVLTWVFAHSSLLITMALAAVMTFNSALHSSSRVKSKYPGLFLDNLVATALSIWPVAIVGSLILPKENWWQVDVFIPMVGMMLGNTLNGLSMGLDTFVHDVKEKREEVMNWLALGATREESTQTLFRKSLKIALSPSINSMLSMGIVSIPGMMTGQILAGAKPMEAAQAQMVLMMLVTTGTYLGTYVGLVLSRRRLYTKAGHPCF